jgi:hypothetical protein
MFAHIDTSTVSTSTVHALVLTGTHSDLLTIARELVALSDGRYDVALYDYPAGERLIVLSGGTYVPGQAKELVEQRIQEGLYLTVESGPTYVDVTQFTYAPAPLAITGEQVM